MSTPLNTEDMAKQDIAARPEITGGETEQAPEKREKLKITSIEEEVGPDELEVSAAKVVSKTLDELKTLFNMEKDEDFTRLLSETLSGSFAAIRAMSGMPWVRFAIAVSAIGVSFVPACLRYSRSKKEKKENNE